jgi:hypothetical protein
VSVLMLGRRESGKTVLLASMWRELAFGGSAGVLVTTDFEQDATDLGIVCRSIENPDSELPHSTPLGEDRKWNFVVEAMDSSGRKKEAFRFSCLDYAGEMLDNLAEGREVSTGLAHELDNADILMGVLDGQKVARLMRGAADDDFSTVVRELCSTLMRRSDKTLHFIITKWDLIAGKHSLNEVIAKLKEENPFRNLLETPRQGGVRFMPVSSLGLNGFVYEDPDTGKMEKVPGKPWKPHYVTLPLACAIPDAIATDVAALREARQEEKESRQERRINARKPLVTTSDVSRIFFWVTLALGLAVDPATAAPVAPKEVRLKVPLDNLQEKAGKIIRRARGRGVPARLADESSALLRAMTFLGGEVDQVERDIPAATLRPGQEVAA